MNANKLIALLAVLVILGVAGFFLYQSGMLSTLTAGLVSAPVQEAKASQYSAVFLSNGQVYFGRVANSGSQYVTLTDVFYLRAAQTLNPGDANKAENVTVDKTKKTATGSAQTTATPEETPAPASNNLTLIKLGGELHGPTDELKINRDHVLLIEGLRDDSKVVRAIADYRQQQPK